MVIQRQSAKIHPRPSMHQKKLMVSAWQSSAGGIHYSFMRPGQSITADLYREQLKEMRRQLQIIQSIGQQRQTNPPAGQSSTKGCKFDVT